jgi:hypothetical protein
MIGVIEDVEGLDYLNVIRYTRRPTLDFIVKSGDAELTPDGIQITSDTVEETITIRFLTSTTFRVRGSVSGFQTAILGGVGTLNQTYSVKNLDSRTMCTFTIAAGAQPMQPGDRARIKLTPVAANIQLSEGEFPVAGNITITVQGGIE